MKQKKYSIYFKEVSDITSEYYFELFKNFIKKNSKVLDFGCGNGALLSKLNINEKVGIENNQFSTKELNKKKNKKFCYFKKC